MGDLEARAEQSEGVAARWVGGAVAFTLPALIGTLYALNHFYVRGASMWDTGWSSYLASHARGLALPNPPAIGGSYYSDHVSVVFALLSWVRAAVPFGSDAAYFAATQGLWYGLMAFGIWLALRGTESLLAPVLATITAFNGVTLATMGFPHIEVATPALLIVFVALFRDGARWPACLILIPLLLVREDAGIHAALLMGVIGLYLGRKKGRPHLLVGAGCLAASIVSFAMQRVVLEGGYAFGDTYLGGPSLAYLTPTFLASRLAQWVISRSYIYVPVAVMLGAAWWLRSPLLALGTLACVPWTLLALIALSEQAGTFWNYYGFPFIWALAWPAVSLAIAPFAPRAVHLWVQAAVALLSIGLFAVSPSNADRSPWRSLAPLPAGRIEATERALDLLLAHRSALGVLVVDDGVGSLRPGAFSGSELRFFMRFTADETRRIETMIYMPDGFVTANRDRVIETAHLSQTYDIRGTGLKLRTRKPIADAEVLDLLAPAVDQ